MTRFSFVALLSSLAPLYAADNRVQPSIEFTTIPAAGPGNANRVQFIEGRVIGAQPGLRIVLFSHTAKQWWVQPTTSHPFTDIQPDSRWKALTHSGETYAALLVDSAYVPPNKTIDLPEKGGSVRAVAIANPTITLPPPATIQFSGYPWSIHEGLRQEGGEIKFYEPSNVWTDDKGFLHLRMTKSGDHWLSSEATLTRGLGYGSYRFVVRDIAPLEPSAVFILGPSVRMAIEISRWGRPDDKNGQYVIAPYIVPANTVRFQAPSGTLTHSIVWQPGRVTFRTVRGTSTVAEHVFTSGVPEPGKERISLNLYDFSNTPNRLQHKSEVIVEKFEFLP